ncbi:hypothetical protein MRX96_029626 [Rhipicephalus microplus]
MHAAMQASDKVATRNAATQCSGNVAFKVTNASIGIHTASTLKETECQTNIGLSDVVAHLKQPRCSTPVAPVIPAIPATPVSQFRCFLGPAGRSSPKEVSCIYEDSHLELFRTCNICGLPAQASVKVKGFLATVQMRHPQVKKYLRTEKPGIEHLFDAWHVGKGTEAFEKLYSLLTAKRLLNDIRQTSPQKQTYSVELFDAIINRFAPKSYAFSYHEIFSQ